MFFPVLFRQGLFFGLGVGLFACQEQPAHTALPTRIFRRGQQLTYQVAHRPVPGAPAQLDTLSLLCYGQYKPADHYGATSPDQPGDTSQVKVGFSYGAITSPVAFAGVIEDDSTLWSHPPREGEYRILELSPYPYLKFPLVKGKHWTDSLAVGEWYGNPAWAVWKGDMLVKSKYVVQGQQQLQTPFGTLSCWVIQATATCAKGTSTLETWYHPQYGFVRLNYETINHKILDLGLVRVTTVQIPDVPTKGLPNFTHSF
jgi:hypothetical protein